MDKREGWQGKQSKWCADSKRSLFSDDICLSSLNTFSEQTTKRLASLLPEGKLGSSHYNSLNTRQQQPEINAGYQNNHRAFDFKLVKAMKCPHLPTFINSKVHTFIPERCNRWLRELHQHNRSLLPSWVLPLLLMKMSTTLQLLHEGSVTL